MCIRRGLEQLGRVILAAFVILVSVVGGSCKDTGVLPRDSRKKRLPVAHYDIHYLRGRNANNFKEGAGQNDLLISW